MSYIFEALQRAETERAGGSVPKHAESVTELLQVVEEEIARKQAEAALEKAASTENAVVNQAQNAGQAKAGSWSIQAQAEPAVVEPTFFEPTPVESMRVESAAVEPAPVVPALKPKVADPLPIAAATVASATPTSLKPVTVSPFSQAKVLTPDISPDSRLVCLTDQGSLPAEKFRMLGLKLRHMRDKRKLKRIVVTGTAPAEGKSLVAANLALNQSRSKVLKTLLIDGDLRRPTVASRFGFERSLPGLSECLRGERDLTESVYKLHGSGLYFLPAGRAPENPLELMQGGRLPELLEHLGNFFDWIIIDTPPVVPVADTTFWMRLADGVLMVIREGVSEKKVVERALDSFDRAALLGVVVNSCSRSDHETYYSRYGQSPSGAPDAAGGTDGGRIST